MTNRQQLFILTYFKWFANRTYTVLPVRPESVNDILLSNPECHESQQSGDEYQYSSENLKPQFITKAGLNDLVRALGLTKKEN